MVQKKVTVPLAIITVIAGIAGGSYAFDFSQETTISGDTITSGDTTITNEGDIVVEIKEDIALVAICLMEPIPEEYTKACEDR